jgi:ArsR family transcriptional regulator, arsenate/arsenite/antimonite-responsive transcriptional repressor
MPINIKGKKVFMEKEKFLERMGALSDRTRFEILQLLSKSPEICACELLKELSISQGTLSHHMKILLDIDLVVCRKDGKWCHYSLNRKALAKMADDLRCFLK